MVECITLRPTWQDGIPVPAGSAVSLSASDAVYAESIGRVERVAPRPPEAIAAQKPTLAPDQRKKG